MLYIHAGIFDHDGVFREKRLPVAQFKTCLEQGWSFIEALPWWGPNDELRANKAWHSAPCQFDTDTLRPYPFEEDAGLIIADYAAEQRSLSPRALLQDLLLQAAELGIGIEGASEFELIILDQAPDELLGTDFLSLIEAGAENRCWSGSYPASGADLFAEYEAMLIRAEIPPHHLCSELGPGCIEVAMPQRPLMRAADDAALFKLFSRSFFYQRQQTASFMAQLSEKHPGLGGHPIISLVDLESGEPLLADTNSEHGLSKTGAHFLAGILQLTPALTAMFAGNVNAYRRYAPTNWAPRTATWGRNNYTCGARLITQPTSAARIEYRLPGADINPFMAFAMLVGSGLYGLREELPLPAETSGNGRDTIPEQIGRLPRNLYEAADWLEDCAEARTIFGDAFIQHHVDCCRYEADSLAQAVSPQERQRYLFHV